MQSRWNDTEAQHFIDAAQAQGQPAALGLRVYTSRLIGQDPDLVLHGGGNTSVKIPDAEGGAIIHVKGSGWDLGDIEAPGLPAMWLEPLLKTRDVAHMSDEDMVAYLRRYLLDQTAPNPSIEALLHAYMPHAFVDHTHATAILALADQQDMETIVAEIYGDRVGFVPYVMPGYQLSHACKDALARDPSVEGLWLEQHGLFTFADTAQASYELMIEFVTLAEAYLAGRGITVPGPEQTDRMMPQPLADTLRAALAAGGALGAEPAIDFRSSPSIRTYLARPNLAELSRRGTATPDHVIRIKPFAMILTEGAGRPEIDLALEAYADEYAGYFNRNAPNAAEPKVMLDPLPRGVLVPGVGIFGLGANEKAARIAGDLYEQTARIVNAAEDYKRFTPISEADLFDMEYWSLEQAKLRK
ncbi:class II aldolase/adducin family protein [Tritonibacter mobilis]|uniref:class II aldolase/adducin family protein n=1 Tax=Tritonibacter mobilis TaxID=379347 RepID=UPI000806C11C|nr:class II aldolase/adducin family protein [Tritonibacter mobilis]GLP88030.1 short-chain dehydrogenase [Tritonibacter mobilis]SDX29817.1 Rhamnose utilisation protein RhaD, predicted bifunctional aldolase and dehydrogenase [Tritonibacter mobilis]